VTWVEKRSTRTAPHQGDGSCADGLEAVGAREGRQVKQGARSVMRREEGHGGEDSYMNVCHQGSFAMGVADGVYMWRTQVRPCFCPCSAPWAMRGVCERKTIAPGAQVKALFDDEPRDAWGHDARGRC
jgi:hypothetical protein